MYSATTATKKIAKMNKRLRAVQGGTSASKSVSILLWLINLCQSDKKPTLTSVVSESFPHLKRGVMRDFTLIMESHGYFKDSRWHKSEYTYTFETGSKLEFFSVDQPSKVRGPRRDRLFINECNNIPYEAFDQLEVRTKDFIYLDWNPTNEFWFYTDILGQRDDLDHITLTYLDNEALDPEIVKSIEQRKHKTGWWKVYGLGQLGEVEGKIFKDWAIIDKIPHEARLVRYGLDYGYSNDPAVIVAIYEHNGGYIVDEILHKKGMLNKQLADIILSQDDGGILTVADSAEPKSIDEMKGYGVNIVGAKKKNESLGGRENYVKWSIGLVQQQRMSVTKRSTNVIHCYRNYLWETDKDGKILNVPEHTFSDPMDAIRYPIQTLIQPERKGFHIRRPNLESAVKRKGFHINMPRPRFF